MNPVKRGELTNIIVSAYAEYLDNGEIEELTTKGESNCHFFEPFIVENHKVVLRLDWADLDAEGHPTLDADFYDPETGKKRSLRGTCREAHHTNAKSAEGRTYEFEFKEYSRPFKVVVHWLARLEEHISMSDSVSCEVIRGGKSDA